MSTAVNSAASLGLSIGTDQAIKDIGLLKTALGGLGAELAILTASMEQLHLGQQMKTAVSGVAPAVKDEFTKAKNAVKTEMSASDGKAAGAAFGNGVAQGVEQALKGVVEKTEQTMAKIRASVSAPIPGGRMTMSVSVPADAAKDLVGQAAAFQANPGAAIAAAKQLEEQKVLGAETIAIQRRQLADESALGSDIIAVRRRLQQEQVALGNDTIAVQRRLQQEQVALGNDTMAVQKRLLTEQVALGNDTVAIQRRLQQEQVALGNDTMAIQRRLQQEQVALGNDTVAIQRRLQQEQVALGNDTMAIQRRFQQEQVALGNDTVAIQRRQMAEKKAADAEQLANARFHMASLKEQVAQLKLIQQLQSMGPAGASAAAGMFTTEVRAQLVNLPQLEQKLAALTGAHGANSQANRLNAAATRELHDATRGLGQSMGALWATYGQLIPMMAGFAAGAAVANVFKLGKDAEYQIAFVRGMSEEMVNLQDVMKVTAGTTFTPKQGIEGLRALSQAGISVSDSLAILPEIMHLSELGEMSMSAAALAVTGSLRAFNLEVSDAGRVADVFAKAGAVSNTSVARITESMKQASTVADFYHISLEQTAASLAVMAKRNIDGTASGTALRNALKELVTPTKAASDALKKMNVDAFDKGSLKEYNALLDEFKKKTDGLNEQGRLTFLNDVFGERGAKAMNAILTDYDLYKKTLSELSESTGFLSRAQAELANTAQGAYLRMSSALQGSLIKAFDSVSASATSFFDTLAQGFASDAWLTTLQTLINGIAQVSTFIVDHIGLLVKLAATYATVKLGLALVTSVLGSLTAGMAAVAAVTGGTVLAAVTALVGTLGLLAVAVGAGIALWAAWPRPIDQVKAAQDANTAAMVQATRTMVAENEQISRQIDLLEQQRTGKAASRRDNAAGSYEDAQTNIAKLESEKTALQRVQRDTPKKVDYTFGEVGDASNADNGRATRAARIRDIEKDIADIREKSGAFERARDAEHYSAERLSDEQARSKVRSDAERLQSQVTSKNLPDKYRNALNDMVKRAADKDRDSSVMTIEMAKLDKEIQSQGGRYTKGKEKVDHAGERADNRAYTADLAELKEKYAEEKKLADLEMATELAITNDSLKAKVISNEDAEKAIARIRETYDARMLANAQTTNAGIIQLVRATERDRELIDQDAFKRRTDRDREYARVTEENAKKVAANKANIDIKNQAAKFEGDISEVDSKTRRGVQDQTDKYDQRFMSAPDAAVAAESVKITGTYAKVIEDLNGKKKTLIELVGAENAAGNAGIQQYDAQIAKTLEHRDAVMADALAETRRLEERKLSWSSGVEDAFNKYSKAAEDHASIAEQAISGSFEKMSAALDTFVTTGKLDFKSLVLSMIQEMIKLKMKDELSSAFGSLGKAATKDGGVLSSTGVIGGYVANLFGSKTATPTTTSVATGAAGDTVGGAMNIFGGMTSAMAGGGTAGGLDTAGLAKSFSDLTKTTDTTSGSLTNMSTTGIGGVLASTGELIIKQLFGTVVEGTAAATTTTTTIAVGSLAGAATAASIALSALAGAKTAEGVAKIVGTVAQVAHTGGIVGGSLGSRSVSLASFAGAPRFHTGGMIGAGEVPIIAQRGEGVFTPEQMANLAPVGGGGGGTSVVVNVNIASDGGSTSETKAKGDSSGKELAQMVETVVQTWVTREKRPGGQLAA